MAVCSRFRWVQCQIDMLEKCAPGPEIQRALKSLPEGLEETYRRILLAIDRSPSDARLVQRVLVWLVASLRPIRMTELLEGIAIDPQYHMLDSSYSSMKGTNFLLEVCQSLVVHDDDTDIIALSHMSVKVSSFIHSWLHLFACSSPAVYAGVPHGRTSS
jgi:hypothetical protein